MARLLLAVWLATVWPVQAAEPPDAPGLVCQVLRQSLDQGLTLELQLRNDGDSPLTLAPGPHLVWYADAAAQESLTHSAPLRRVVNGPLVLPPRDQRTALWRVDAAGWEALRCNPVGPAAAALAFFQFNPRPQFRCRLLGYLPHGLEPRRDCPP